MKKFFNRLIMGEEKKEYQPPTELRIFSHALPKRQPNFPKWAKEFKVGTHKEPFEDNKLIMRSVCQHPLKYKVANDVRWFCPDGCGYLYGNQKEQL